MVGGRRGVENGPAGGIQIFPAGGEALFASGGGGGGGYCKIAKRALQMYFLREFWKLVKNMCNFAVFRQFFLIFTYNMGKNFS